MTKSKFNLLLVFFSTILLFSCDSDDSANNNDNVNSEQVENFVQNGTWRITYFFDTDSDETSDFNGYSFNFNEDGSLVATNGSTTITGSWSVMDDSSSGDDDGSSGDDDFNIFFPVPDTNDFEDLNDDWDIISVSESKIELTDVSGGNGGTDFLTFEKN